MLVLSVLLQLRHCSPICVSWWSFLYQEARCELSQWERRGCQALRKAGNWLGFQKNQCLWVVSIMNRRSSWKIIFSGTTSSASWYLVMALVESRVGTGLSECLQQREYFWEVLICLHVHRLALPSVCDVWHSGKVRCVVLVWQEEPVACLASNWGTAVAEYQAHKAIFTGSFCSCGREGTSFREEKSGHENLQFTKKRHRHCNLCYDSSGLLLEKGRVSRWGPPYSREQHSFVNSLKPWK